MPFILLALPAGEALETISVQGTPVVQNKGALLRVYLDALLGISFVAVGKIVNHRIGAIRVA